MLEWGPVTLPVLVAVAEELAPHAASSRPASAFVLDERHGPHQGPQPKEGRRIVDGAFVLADQEQVRPLRVDRERDLGFELDAPGSALVDERGS